MCDSGSIALFLVECGSKEKEKKDVVANLIPKLQLFKDEPDSSQLAKGHLELSLIGRANSHFNSGVCQLTPVAP